METIRFGGLELHFLQDRHGTNGGVDLFTTRVSPGAGMPIPHHHEGWDETVYGLAGEVTWRIDSDEVVVGAGQSAFIPRGIVHGFANRSDTDATFLSILTPGMLGPAYFRETAALVNAGRSTPEAMRALMTRYGLIPSVTDSPTGSQPTTASRTSIA